jgi:hypothetical protein
VNGDGIPDVLTANVGSVSLRLGTGPGLGPRTYFTSPVTGNQIVLADMNRDGRLDLVAGGTTGTIVVWLGNGDGTFAPPASHPIASGAVGVAVADMDRDGRPDIVTANAQARRPCCWPARPRSSSALPTTT